jgi:hypothetical protein
MWMGAMVEVVRLDPVHLVSIERQPSQQVQLGLPLRLSLSECRALSDQPEAYAMVDGARVLGCFGLVEAYAGRQAVAWAILASGLHAVHTRMSRFIRRRIEAAGYARIEAVAIAPQTAETLTDALANPTPEMRWARLLGLQPAHLLKKFGAASETHVLFERVAQ